MEIWKDIPNYKNHYQASSYGNIKSVERPVYSDGKLHYVQKEKILKTPVNNRNGYKMVTLCRNGVCKKMTVHQIVCMTFLEHKPSGFKLVCNHKNFNKLDNRVENLEIVTNRENSNQKHLQ